MKIPTISFKHIGYYHGVDAVQYYAEPADAIIRAMKKGLGAFYNVDPSSETDIYDIDKENDKEQFSYSADKNYLVRKEKGANEPTWEGWYIDIYEAVEGFTTEEYCSNCNSFVKLPSDFAVQICPECGGAIVPCNICPLNDDERACANCPLAKYAEIKDMYLRGDVMTFEQFFKKYNSSSREEKAMGFNFTFDSKTLYLHYYEKLKVHMLADTGRSGQSYIWTYNSITPIAFMHGINTMFSNAELNDSICVVACKY